MINIFKWWKKPEPDIKTGVRLTKKTRIQPLSKKDTAIEVEGVKTNLIDFTGDN